MLVGEAKERECTLPAATAEVFDRTFGIRVSKPKVSPDTVNTFCAEMRKLRLGELRPNVAPNGEWFTMGVVVDKSEFKKSGNGNEYMIWRISDLTFGGQTVKVLLFGDSVRTYWKLQLGMTVLLNNPQWAEPTAASQRNEVILKLFKAAQVIELGFCPDFGHCQAKKGDGEQCKNAVNISSSSFCPFHIQQRARELSINRGALNRSFNLPPRNLRSMEEGREGARGCYTPPPANVKTVRGVQAPGGKIYTRPTSSIVQRRIDSRTVEMKEKQMEELNKLMIEKPLSFGARNLLLKQQKEKENMSPRQESAAPSTSASEKSLNSMREFIRSQPNKSTIISKDQMKIKRAAEILRNSAKRPKISTSTSEDQEKHAKKESTKQGTLLGKSFTDEEIRALLEKKSTHDNEAMQEETDRQNIYFKHREMEEQIETNATSMMELKNCKVVTCSICAYTSQHQSTHCKSLGHQVRRHNADKRFFKCKTCQKRTFCYDRMPSRACQGCGSREFYRVAMRDERKVLMETEQLKIKDDEHNWSSTKQ